MRGGETFHNGMDCDGLGWTLLTFPHTRSSIHNGVRRPSRFLPSLPPLFIHLADPRMTPSSVRSVSFVPREEECNLCRGEAEGAMSSSPVGNALMTRRPTSLPPPKKASKLILREAARSASAPAAAAAAAVAEGAATYSSRSAAVWRRRRRGGGVGDSGSASAAFPSPPTATTSVRERYATHIKGEEELWEEIAAISSCCERNCGRTSVRGKCAL